MAAKRKSDVISSLTPSARLANKTVSAGTASKEWTLRHILDDQYGIDEVLVCSLDHHALPNVTTTQLSPCICRWVEDLANLETGKAAGVQTYTFKMENAAELSTNSFFPVGETGGPNHPADYVFSIVDAVGPTTHKIKFQSDGTAVDLGGTGIFNLGSCGLFYGYNAQALANSGLVTIVTGASQPDLTAGKWKMEQGWIVDLDHVLYGFSRSLSSSGTLIDLARKVVVATGDKIHELVTDTLVFNSDIQAQKLQVAVMCTPASHWGDNLSVQICTETEQPNPANAGIWYTISAETEKDLIGNNVLYRFKQDQILTIAGAGAVYALTLRFVFSNSPQRVVDTLVTGYAIGLKP